MNRTFALALVAAMAFGTAAMAADTTPAAAPATAAAPVKADHEGKFAKADTNNDGFISKEEFQAAHMERSAKVFDMMDTNHDGKLSKDELKAGRQQMRQKMQERMAERQKEKAAQ